MKSLADSNSLERWWQEHSELDRLVRGLDATLARATLEKTLGALEEHEAKLVADLEALQQASGY